MMSSWPSTSLLSSASRPRIYWLREKVDRPTSSWKEHHPNGRWVNDIQQNFEMAGRDWLCGFLKRHPRLSFRTPEATALSRLTGFNRVQVGRFYDNSATMMEKNKYPAERIYSMDETGFSTCTNKKEKLLGKKGGKQNPLRGILSPGGRKKYSESE